MDYHAQQVADENLRDAGNKRGLIRSGGPQQREPHRAVLQPLSAAVQNSKSSASAAAASAAAAAASATAASANPVQLRGRLARTADSGAGASDTLNVPGLKRKHSSPPSSDDTIEQSDDDDIAVDSALGTSSRGAAAISSSVSLSASAAAAAAAAAAVSGAMELDDEDCSHHDHSHMLESDDVPDGAELVPGQSRTNPNALYPHTDMATNAELARAAAYVAQVPGVLDEDDEDLWDVSMAAEYSDEIFAYMRRLELQMRPDPGYIDRQREIDWGMRATLIDWLVQVHGRFQLLPETLFLTVNYVDRFLSAKQISLSKFQLVGAVALFLAAKYEEINCPSVGELHYMVDRGYDVDEILRAERYMIDLLDFNLGYPGPMSFLRRTSKADNYDLETRTLAKYLLEVTIMDCRFVGAPASWMAAASHYLSRIMLERGGWTPLHVHFSGYTEKQLVPAADAIKSCFINPREHHRAIFDKYSERRFKKASLYVLDWARRNL